ncbi:MAG: ABC transporter ATP-binding protein [Bacteroidetes bacterium]|nr:ABC transporter ATP-binding protein [Bacteroidota bacterium]
MTKPLLEIKQLSVNFVADGKSSKALENINITVNRGEILAIVGESGSGKSVTALSILQLLPSPPAVYRSGEIILNTNTESINLLTSSSQALQSIRGSKVAMIFQEPMTSLNPVLTCGFQVMEAILQHDSIDKELAKKKTIALFEQVQLPSPVEMFDRYPHQISGGQKQRVMIAMAMSCSPALLICDEPTTALDVTVQKNILQLIRNLQIQNNMGVIFITHDLSVVAEIADRVVVLYKGKIIEEKTTQAIFDNPSHPYTKALLACRPLLHEKGTRLPVVSDFMKVDEAGNLEEIISTPSIVNSKILQELNQFKTDPLVRVEHLKIWYPAKKTFLGKAISFNKAVDDISFDIYPGETLGLVGESGCGKTTLGRALLQLIPTTAGSIYYKDENLANVSAIRMKNLRKEMQLIFQDPYSSLNPRMTIGDAIAEPLLVHQLAPNAKARKEKVIELLEQVNLSADHYHRYPHEFSGGQRQRIVIARALAVKPSFIICDESVSALDVSVQAQVLNLLNDLKQTYQFTAVFISHDLSVVRYISDRIMVMNQGKMAEIGLANDVYLNPQSDYTRKLIDSIPKARVSA